MKHISAIQLDEINDYLNLLFPSLQDDEYICLQCKYPKGAWSEITLTQSRSDVAMYISSNYNNDVYIGMATIDANKVDVDKPGRDENVLKSASVIALDFDFKDADGNYLEKMPVREFAATLRKSIPLFITAIVDSGHGYQIYIPIERTTNLKRWNALTRQLCNILGADSKATLPTQIMRLPNSLNHKVSGDEKSCNLIYINTEYTRLSLDDLERQIEVFFRKQNSSIPTNYMKVRPCIINMQKGVRKGHRNFCLGRIIKSYQVRGCDKEKVLNLCLKYNQKCNPPKPEKVVKQDFEAYWNKPYNLIGCSIPDSKGNAILKEYCDNDCQFRSGTVSDSRKLSINETLRERIVVSKKLIDPASELTGNDIAIGVLISKENCIKKGDLYAKISVSKKTARVSIENLCRIGLIKVSGRYVYNIAPKTTNRISIACLPATMRLEERLSKASTKLYYSIAYLDSVEKNRLTRWRLICELSADRSNLARYLHELEDKNLIKQKMSNDSHVELQTAA